MEGLTWRMRLRILASSNKTRGAGGNVTFSGFDEDVLEGLESEDRRAFLRERGE